MLFYRTRFALRAHARTLDSGVPARAGFTSCPDNLLDDDADGSDVSTDDFPDNDDDSGSDYMPSDHSSSDPEQSQSTIPAKRMLARSAPVSPPDDLNNAATCEPFTFSVPLPSRACASPVVQPHPEPHRRPISTAPSVHLGTFSPAPPPPRPAAAHAQSPPRPAKFARSSQSGGRIATGPSADPHDADDETTGNNNRRSNNRRRNRERRGTQRFKERRSASHSLKVVQTASVVSVDVDVTSHGDKAGFLTPARYRDGQCAPPSSNRRPVRLHPQAHPDVRKLVEQESFTYIRPGQSGIQITDKNGVVFAAVGRRCSTPGYDETIRRVFLKATAVRTGCQSPNLQNNPRGAFSRAQYGTSFGGGQKRPTQINNSLRVQKAMQGFFWDDDTRVVVRHMTDELKRNFPLVHKEYTKLNAELGLNDLFCKPGDDPDDLNFLFAATTLNLGPQVVTISHRDAKNLQPGICAIIALGLFNPQTGGHFVMREPRVLVEFRPGDVLFVMSSVVTHFNIPLATDAEQRMSLTFYTAGGLFRWEVAGRRTLKSLNTPQERATYRERAHEFIRKCWSNLLTHDELITYWKSLAHKR